MVIRKIVLLSSFLFLIGLSSYAQTNNYMGEKSDDYKIEKEWIVEKIIITGNKKTKRSAVLKGTELVDGKVYKKISLKALKTKIIQKLNNLKFFFDSDVFFQKVADNKVNVTIKLKDKWTFFPIPVVAYSQDVFKYGLAFLEGNFLGTMNQLGAGIVVKDKKLNWFSLLFLKNFLIDDFTLTMSAISTTQKMYEYMGTTLTNDYDYRSTGGFLNFQYAFKNRINLSLRMDMYQNEFDNQPSTVKSKWETYGVFSFMYEGLDYKEDFVKGLRLRLSYAFDFKLLGSQLDREIFEWRFQYAINPILNHNLVFKQAGMLTKDLEPGYFLRVGGVSNVDLPSILGYKESQYRARHAIISYLDYRIPFWKLDGFTFSLVPFVNHAYFSMNTRISDFQSKFSYGLSFRIYLRKILMPAFILYGVRAVDNAEFTWGVILGAQL